MSARHLELWQAARERGDVAMLEEATAELRELSKDTTWLARLSTEELARACKVAELAELIAHKIKLDGRIGFAALAAAQPQGSA